MISLLYTARSDRIDWDNLSLYQLTHLCSVFCSSGPSDFSFLNLPFGSIYPSPRFYYNIEVLNNPSIEYIFIVIIRSQYLTRNNGVKLVLNSDPG